MPSTIKKISDLPLSPCREWYNEWVERNAEGKVLDVGKSIHWEYGFNTIDNNPEIKPTFIGNICKTEILDNTYDTVLCMGMYEFVEDPQAMVDEIYRILKKGGKVLFGFVGKNYIPYKKDWKFYDNNIDFGNFKILKKKDFNDYHFIVCKK